MAIVVDWNFVVCLFSSFSDAQTHHIGFGVCCDLRSWRAILVIYSMRTNARRNRNRKWKSMEKEANEFKYLKIGRTNDGAEEGERERKNTQKRTGIEGTLQRAIIIVIVSSSSSHFRFRIYSIQAIWVGHHTTEWLHFLFLRLSLWCMSIDRLWVSQMQRASQYGKYILFFFSISFFWMCSNWMRTDGVTQLPVAIHQNFEWTQCVT